MKRAFGRVSDARRLESRSPGQMSRVCKVLALEMAATYNFWSIDTLDAALVIGLTSLCPQLDRDIIVTLHLESTAKAANRTPFFLPASLIR